MLNRTIPPSFKQIQEIPLIQPTHHKLANDIPLFNLNAGDQDLIRIEFLFPNVNWDERFPLQAFATNSLLAEGSKGLTAFQIAERIDYFGAFIQTDFNYDYSSVTVYTLTKHLPEVLPILRSVITEAEYPVKELETFKINQKQKLSVSMVRNDYLSRREFNHLLFGNNQYGSLIEASDYDLLDRAQLTNYFRAAYQPSNCTIITAGKVGQAQIDLINEYFGRGWSADTKATPNNFSFVKKSGELRYEEKPNALQSAIRIGNMSINRTHSDFPGMQVLNTVLGGYFGSRLMSNIREDKGYTYGIGSALVSLQHSGYFFIASEVGSDVCNAAISEIEKEINILRNEAVSGAELDTVKNYMLGSFLGGLENAFSHADKFKNILISGLDYTYYDRYIEVVKNISASDLQELANKYLNFGDFNKVVVGKM